MTYEARLADEARAIARRADAGELSPGAMAAVADAMLAVAPGLREPETRRAVEALVRSIQDRIGARAI